MIKHCPNNNLKPPNSKNILEFWTIIFKTNRFFRQSIFNCQKWNQFLKTRFSDFWTFHVVDLAALLTIQAHPTMSFLRRYVQLQSFETLLSIYQKTFIWQTSVLKLILCKEKDFHWCAPFTVGLFRVPRRQTNFYSKIYFLSKFQK